MWGIGKIPEIITGNQLNNSSKRRSQISTIITELKTCWYYIVIVLFIDWFTNLTPNIRGSTTLVINNSSWNSVPQEWGQCAPSLMLFLEPGSSKWWNFYRENSSFNFGGANRSFFGGWGGLDPALDEEPGTQNGKCCLMIFLDGFFPMG